MSSDTAIELYKSAGLTEAEARLVEQWIEDGKPGLAQSKAEQLLTIYLNGYTCEEMQKQFPQYPLALLLWAKATYRWDDARDRYRANVSDQVVQTALAACSDSIRFISDLMSATHIKLRKEIMAYMVDPDNTPPPSLLPMNIKEYAVLHNTMKEAMGSGKGPKSDGDVNPSSLNININTEKSRPTIDVQPVDMKAALKASLGKK